MTPKTVPIILLVDDDAGHRVLIKENLAAGGTKAKVMEVGDGQEGLDYLFRRGKFRDPDKSPRPSLILLDVKMPKADGYVVLQRVKSDPTLGRIPIIMLTSTDDQMEINQCYALGANGCIVKPVDYEALQQRVKALGAFLKYLRVPE